MIFQRLPATIGKPRDIDCNMRHALAASNEVSSKRRVTMAESRIGQKIKAYCSKCKGARNCDIHGHYAERGDDGHYQWYRDWYLLACCGCEHVFAQSVSTDSESLIPYYDHIGDVQYEHDETIVMWPAKAKRERPEWFDGDTI